MTRPRWPLAHNPSQAISAAQHPGDSRYGLYQEIGHENGCRGISSIYSPTMKAIRAVLVELGHFENLLKLPK